MKTSKGKINERGYSLIEALVTLVLFSAIVIMLYELMIGSLRASLFVEGRNDLEVFAQRTVNTVQASVLQSRMLYTENTTGIGYRDLFIASGLGGFTILPDSRLPVVNDVAGAVLIPDASGEEFVGNQLIVVRALEPVPVPYDHDGDAGAVTPEIDFLADRYKLEFYFLSRNTARNFNRTGSFVDIIKSHTEDFADYFQLSSLPTARRAEVADGLLLLPGALTASEQLRLGIDGPILLAWNPAEPVATAFYTFDNAGVFTLAATPTIVFKTKSAIPELAGGRVSGKMEYSVCTNSNTPLPNGKFGPLGIPDIVPLYGQIDTEFPAGLEFKIVGPTGARSVLNRMVLCSEHMRELTSQESFVITSSREF